jgi:hypothetical protein
VFASTFKTIVSFDVPYSDVFLFPVKAAMLARPP